MGSPDSEQWLRWARELQAIAQAGLYYTADRYDRERYTRLQAIAYDVFAACAGMDVATVSTLFAGDDGYPTPKIDVRAVIFQDAQVLLVQERADGCWSLPGGWCDINQSPSETAVREVEEEAGVVVRTVKLLALYDRDKQGYPPISHHTYKAFIRCEIIAGTAGPGEDTLAAAFFAEDALPPLSLSRISAAHLHRMFEHLRDPFLPADFD